MTPKEAIEYMAKGGCVKHIQEPPSQCHHRMYHHQKVIKLKECGCTCASEVKQIYSIDEWLSIAEAETGGFIAYNPATKETL